MKKTAEIRICDICKKNVSDDGERRIGGSAFNRWLHIERINGGTSLYDLEQQKEFDVCSIDCGIKLLTKLKNSRE